MMISPDENQAPAPQPEGDRALQAITQTLSDIKLVNAANLTSDFTIDCEFPSWPPLAFQISYTFLASGAIDTIRVQQKDRYGDSIPGGFVLSGLPAELQEPLAPLALTCVASESRLVAMLEAVSQFYRFAVRTGRTDACIFKEVFPSAENENFSLSAEESQAFVAAGIEPPVAGTRIEGRDKISFISTSHIPPSIEVWANGRQYSHHVVHSLGELGKSARTSRLKVALFTDFNLRVERNILLEYLEDGKLILLPRAHHSLPGIENYRKFIGQSNALIEGMIDEGAHRAKFKISTFDEFQAKQNEREALCTKVKLTNGIVVRLNKIDRPKIQIFVNENAAQADQPLISIQPNERGSASESHRVEIGNLFNNITTNNDFFQSWAAQEISHKCIITWNSQALLPQPIEELKKLLLRTGPKNIEWLERSAALPDSAEALEMLFAGKHVITLRHREFHPNALTNLTVVFQGDIIERIQFSSNRGWKIVLNGIRSNFGNYQSQVDWLQKLAHQYSTDPYQALNIAFAASTSHETTNKMTLNSASIDALRLLDNFYYVVAQNSYGQRIPEFKSFVASTFVANENHYQILVKGSSNRKNQMSVVIDPRGIVQATIYRYYSWLKWFGGEKEVFNFHSAPIKAPEEMITLLRKFNHFDVARSVLKGSELQRYLGSRAAVEDPHIQT